MASCRPPVSLLFSLLASAIVVLFLINSSHVERRVRWQIVACAGLGLFGGITGLWAVDKARFKMPDFLHGRNLADKDRKKMCVYQYSLIKDEDMPDAPAPWSLDWRKTASGIAGGERSRGPRAGRRLPPFLPVSSSFSVLAWVLVD